MRTSRLNSQRSLKAKKACAFANCSKLTKVSFGTGITTLEDNVFNSCNKLNTLIFNGTEPPTLQTPYSLPSTTFNPDLKIYVPDSVVDVYKNSSQIWSVFYADCIHPLSEYTEQS